MPVRVLVVDDSPTMRGIIAAVLRRDPDIEIVATAGDAFQARDAIIEHKPDVITLDFEMPGMDGITFLKKIMARRPTPVIMISSAANRKGADLAIHALSNGAFECLAKPEGGLNSAEFRGLPDLVKAASRHRVAPTEATASAGSQPQEYQPGNKILAIGASTGGVEALTTLLSGFPENCPPTVIVQHMPEHFTASFAERLNRLCQPTVCEARDGDVLQPGHIFLAPGSVSHLTVQRRDQFKCRLVQSDKVSGHRPSVDVLFQSVAECAGKRSIGVILTGMGADGAQGLLELRQAGGITIGQDEASSTIYGMPKAAFERNAVQKQLPLTEIAGEILRVSSRMAGADHAA